VTDLAKIELTGFEELDRAFKVIPPKLRRKALRTAMRRGIVLIRDEVKQTAPIRQSTKVIKYQDGVRPKPGRLRRLVRVKPRRPKRGYMKVSLLYPTQGAGNDPKNAFYWRFIEFGTRHFPARAYIRRATSKNFGKVVQTINRETLQLIITELRKAS
jgi:HK97 gp10 family phage protein